MSAKAGRSIRTGIYSRCNAFPEPRTSCPSNRLAPYADSPFEIHSLRGCVALVDVKRDFAEPGGKNVPLNPVKQARCNALLPVRGRHSKPPQKRFLPIVRPQNNARHFRNPVRVRDFRDQSVALNAAQAGNFFLRIRLLPGFRPDCQKFRMIFGPIPANYNRLIPAIVRRHLCLPRWFSSVMLPLTAKFPLRSLDPAVSSKFDH